MKIVAVDVGTSRIKAAVFTDSGAMIALADRRLPRLASPTTQSALEWAETTEELLHSLAGEHAPEAVVLTGNMHALLAVDAAGEPLAPAVLWNDTSTQAETAELNRQGDAELLRQFGNTATPVFTFPKMMKFRREQPDAYARTKAFLQSKDFIALRLTGQYATDPVDASGVLGMDLDTQTWNSVFFTEFGLDVSKMPAIRPSTAIVGAVTAMAARRTGLRAGIPVIIGAGDLSTAAVGSGVDEETMSLTLGTAGQLLAAGDRAAGEALAGRLFVFSHADPRLRLFLGSVPAGGFNFEWIAGLFGISVPEFFQTAAAGAAPDELPVYLPYILGRGAPFMDYVPDGSWRGLTASHRREDLCRAAVLGTLSALRQSGDLLETIAGKRPRLALQALACREAVVRDAAAGLFAGKELLLPENSEASLVGAAAIALVGLNLVPDFRSAIARLFRASELPSQPDDAIGRYYQRFLARQQE
ncbi:MAG: FGGY family carbohydrate kinase [Lentisphaeria bacterium]|jgi:xylulokinase